MNIEITEEVLNLFPGIVVCAAVVRRLDNTRAIPELDQFLRAEETKVRQTFGSGPISEHERIVVWREAYRAFGAKPKDYPSSIENLIRRVSKGWTIPRINTLVDLYNLVSLRHLVPAGGEDLDQIRGDIRLARAGPNDPAVLLLGEQEPRPPRAGEVIYRDDLGTFCRRLNWKEAERTKLTAATTNALLVIEGLPPLDQRMVSRATEELADLAGKYCGGSTRVITLSASLPRAEL